MKRYCLVKNKNDFSFQTGESDMSYDVYLPNVINQVKTEPYSLKSIDGISKWIHGANWEVEVDYRLTQIKYTSEFMLDILNEVYLSLIYLEGKTVKLFSRSGKRLDDEVNVAIKQARKNIFYKERKKPENEIFDIDVYLKSEKQTAEIPELGSEVAKLWLCSSKIRNILVDRARASKNYDVFKIVAEIEKMESIDAGKYDIEEGGLKFKEDDAIILERIFGISLERAIQNYLIPKLKDERINLNELVKAITEYHGEYVRIFLVEMLANNLDEFQRFRKPYDEKNLIKEYTKYISNNKAEYNNTYKAVHDKVIKKYGQIYGLETVRKIVEQKRKDIKNKMYPTMVTTPTIKSQREKYVKSLIKKEKWDELTDMIVNESYAINHMPSFYFEYEHFSFERNNIKYSEVTNSKLWGIEKTIIEGNKLRYVNI